jgi:hypothetical protein
LSLTSIRETWRRILHIGGTFVLSGLSAYGAAHLALGFGLRFEGATLACTTAFFCNFFMIDGLVANIIRR